MPIEGGPLRGLDLESKTFLLNVPIPLHPDGRQIAYVDRAVQMEVWKLENFLPPQ